MKVIKRLNKFPLIIDLEWIIVLIQATIPPGNPGSLTGAITWMAGNVPMPNNGPQLGDCEIKLIQKWVEKGLPDN